MYLILEGRVRVHDGDRILNELSQPDLFGEMALLDAAPRLASVTAITASTLWRLDQKTFYNLMSKQSEVATGIIKVLTKRLRERVSDVIELKTQLLKSTGDS
jgi:CRP-like cAMP-binding protein